MLNSFNILLDKLSHYLAQRKGLLPILGVLLVLLNFGLQFIADNWFAQSDFFLHLGIILAIIGIVLAWAL